MSVNWQHGVILNKPFLLLLCCRFILRPSRVQQQAGERLNLTILVRHWIIGLRISSRCGELEKYGTTYNVFCRDAILGRRGCNGRNCTGENVRLFDGGCGQRFIRVRR